MFVRMNNYQILKFAKYSNLETFKLINGNFNNVNFTSILRGSDMVIIDYLVKENLINYELLDLHKSYSKEVIKFVIENAQKDSLGNEWWELGFFNDINLDNKSLKECEMESRYLFGLIYKNQDVKSKYINYFDIKSSSYEIYKSGNHYYGYNTYVEEERLKDNAEKVKNCKWYPVSKSKSLHNFWNFDKNYLAKTYANAYLDDEVFISKLLVNFIRDYVFMSRLLIELHKVKSFNLIKKISKLIPSTLRMESGFYFELLSLCTRKQLRFFEDLNIFNNIDRQQSFMNFYNFKTLLLDGKCCFAFNATVDKNSGVHYYNNYLEQARRIYFIKEQKYLSLSLIDHSHYL